jgi:hypothetical protein
MNKFSWGLLLSLMTINIMHAQKTIIYKIEIDSTNRKGLSFEKPIPKYVRLDFLKAKDYIDPGQDAIGYNYYYEYQEALKKTDDYYAEVAGIVKNKRDYWLHPPRLNEYFRMLEFNPFPFYKSIRDDWTWFLFLEGYQWGNKKWVEWDGGKRLDYQYHISNKNFKIEIGKKKISCIEIEGNMNSDIGNTKSIFYLVPQQGFIKIINYLINGDIMTMTKVN